MIESRPAPVLVNTPAESAGPELPAVKKRLAWVSVAIVFAAFLLLVWTVQHRAGAPTAAFGAFPDEPAHFVGGLLFRDYLDHAFGKPPIPFVSDYHLHLPYFALGVWPPFFYLIEGAWTEVFGERRASVLWLIAVIAAGLAAMLFRILEKQFDAWTALAGGAMFLLVPVVQWSDCVVMADLICSLFAMAAIVYFARFMDSRRWFDAAIFGVFSGLALLTKNSTYFLVLIPVIVIPARARWDLLRTRALWIAPLVVASLYVPWLVISRPFLLLGIHGLQLPGFLGTQWDYFVTLWRQTSFLLPLAVGGACFLIGFETSHPAHCDVHVGCDTGHLDRHPAGEGSGAGSASYCFVYRCNLPRMRMPGTFSILETASRCFGVPISVRGFELGTVQPAARKSYPQHRRLPSGARRRCAGRVGALKRRRSMDRGICPDGDQAAAEDHFATDQAARRRRLERNQLAPVLHV